MTRIALGLDRQCALAGLPTPTKELRFAPPRCWRFDLAWEDRRFACEIEGGVFLPGGSRHSRGRGYENDCIKYAEALCRGWRVLRVTTDMVRDGRALFYLECLLRGNYL
jgi:hypothetical protein